MEAFYLKTKTSESTRSNHIGQNNGKTCEGRYFIGYSFILTQTDRLNVNELKKVRVNLT